MPSTVVGIEFQYLRESEVEMLVSGDVAMMVVELARGCWWGLDAGRVVGSWRFFAADIS